MWSRRAIEFPLRLPRRFELWSHQVSHGVLLPRSAPRPDQPTRIDVQFRFTSDLKLPVVLNDLQGHEPSVFEDEQLVPHRKQHLYHFRD
ncbi:hypothetical protein ABZX92_03335 [Lentzea sp. NPDC006480]|uniref:hypothetical protein n=1 Tax=Lentzea sp. NPDC006480 TaxID=3157176 RepID=UPI0033B1996B